MIRKKVLLAFVLVFLPFVPAVSEGNFPILAKWVLDIYRDGKITEEKMIVSFLALTISGKYSIDWQAVRFVPDKDLKIVRVYPFIYSSAAGTVTNISFTEDKFSFDLKIDQSNSIKIMGNKDIKGKYTIEGVFIYYSEYLKKTVKYEYKSTDKQSIILPFQEIE